MYNFLYIQCVWIIFLLIPCVEELISCRYHVSVCINILSIPCVCMYYLIFTMSGSIIIFLILCIYGCIILLIPYIWIYYLVHTMYLDTFSCWYHVSGCIFSCWYHISGCTFILLIPCVWIHFFLVDTMCLDIQY